MLGAQRHRDSVSPLDDASGKHRLFVCDKMLVILVYVLHVCCVMMLRLNISVQIVQVFGVLHFVLGI